MNKHSHNGGYFRKILHVDMSSGKSTTEAIDDEFIESYIGGRGFAIKLLWDNLAKHGSVDPLGPENMLVVAAGPLTGVYLPSSGQPRPTTIHRSVRLSPSTAAH